MTTTTTTTLQRLLALDRSGLAALFARGRPLRSLTAGRYRGVSLGLPRLVERLTWKLFAKEVVVVDGARRGWNLRLQQPPALDATSLLTAPLVALKRFAPFAINHDDDGDDVIDYRGCQNPFPLSHTIDPLVRVNDDDDDDDVLLGVSDLHIGGRVQRTPTWFALFREVCE